MVHKLLGEIKDTFLYIKCGTSSLECLTHLLFSYHRGTTLQHGLQRLQTPGKYI